MPWASGRVPHVAGGTRAQGPGRKSPDKANKRFSTENGKRRAVNQEARDSTNRTASRGPGWGGGVCRGRAVRTGATAGDPVHRSPEARAGQGRGHPSPALGPPGEDTGSVTSGDRQLAPEAGDRSGGTASCPRVPRWTGLQGSGGKEHATSLPLTHASPEAARGPPTCFTSHLPATRPAGTACQTHRQR